eukprot:SAG11_NODE_38698_length_251_cov_0.677632_1_plen_27_part_10
MITYERKLVDLMVTMAAALPLIGGLGQ